MDLLRWLFDLAVIVGYYALALRDDDRDELAVEPAGLSVRIPTSHGDLLEGPICGALTTMGAGGEPQSSLVWVDHHEECGEMRVICRIHTSPDHPRRDPSLTAEVGGREPEPAASVGGGEDGVIRRWTAPIPYERPGRPGADTAEATWMPN